MKTLAALAVVLLAGGALGACSSDDASQDAPRSTVVHTAAGPVRGAGSPLGTAYRAIPYAAPPVGDLRWRPPQPVQPWDEVLDATEAGAVCPQPDVSGALDPRSDEDCLTLDVHVPEAAGQAGRALPVIVWVHGGGFLTGSSQDQDGARLAATGEVIVVTVDYRLGALGYLALDGLAGEADGDTGAYAVQDVVAALRWVERNIEAFGGDPATVTLAGQSAGAANVCASLATPAAFGLFDRAIIQSGPCTRTLTVDEATEVGGTFAEDVGCDDPAAVVACMRGRSTEDLIGAAGTQRSVLDEPLWLPVTGGITTPVPLLEAVRSGRFAAVPVLMGTVQDEARGEIPHWDTAAAPLDDDALAALAAEHLDLGADDLEAGYPAASATPQERLARLMTDSVFACPTEQVARVLADQGDVSVFRYEFDLPDEWAVAPGTDPGATHNSDLRFVFPATDDWNGDEQRQLSSQMIRYWARFAASGLPSGPFGADGGGTSWPAFTVTDPEVLRLVPGGIAADTTFADTHRCELWT